ncbi:MAG: hypothetical protein HYV07_18685 [Deltaproteobacteria bacterium]|nr:hypothetical protein [Deltaproteobacteria bacterium]
METKNETSKTWPFAFDAAPSMDRMNAALDEMKKLQEAQRKQAEAAIDEWARLTKATLAYGGQLFEAWEKQVRDTTKKTFGGGAA